MKICTLPSPSFPSPLIPPSRWCIGQCYDNLPAQNWYFTGKLAPVREEGVCADPEAGKVIIGLR